MKCICVNCGSSPGYDKVYMEAAQEMGEVIIDRGLELVYGGADVSFFDNAVKSGFMKQGHRDILLVDGSPAGIMEKLGNYQAPNLDKWVGVKVRD